MKIATTLLLAGVLGLVLAGCGGDDAATTTTAATTTPVTTGPGVTVTTRTTPGSPTTPAGNEHTLSLEIKGGKPVGGMKRLKVTRGDHVEVTVSSDAQDRVHLHGYDIAEDVAAGGKATLEFDATIAGRFELESHELDIALAEIEVAA